MSKNNTPPLPAETDSGTDLAQLRDILFGNQAKATDERMADLEKRLENVRRDLTNSLNDGLKNVASTASSDLKNSNQSLSKQLENQQKDANLKFDQLQDKLDQLSADFSQQLYDVQQELQKQINQQVDDLNQKLFDYQSEARRSHDSLRHEMLTLGALLDRQKAGRSELAATFIQLGTYLQEQTNGVSSDIAQEEQ